VHTSGTSADARAVELTYGNWLWSALGSAVALGHDPGERWLCCLPPSHVGGLSILLRSAIGATTAIVHERFDTERVLAELRDPAGPTLVSLVPTTLARLLDAGLERPPALRWALLGGAPIGPGLLDRAQKTAAEHGVGSEMQLIEARGHRIADRIVEAAREAKCDLVVMGTHGRRGFAHALLGSYAERVLRQCPVPVLVARHPEARKG